jgi:hypothetical protein
VPGQKLRAVLDTSVLVAAVLQLGPPQIGWQMDFVVELPLRVSWKLDSVGVRLAPKMAIS